MNITELEGLIEDIADFDALNRLIDFLSSDAAPQLSSPELCGIWDLMVRRSQQLAAGTAE